MSDLYREQDVCVDPLFPHHRQPFKCIVEGCDTRLVPVVPVERCVHGKIDRHIHYDNTLRGEWCEGAGLVSS